MEKPPHARKMCSNGRAVVGSALTPQAAWRRLSPLSHWVQGRTAALENAIFGSAALQRRFRKRQLVAALQKKAFRKGDV